MADPYHSIEIVQDIWHRWLRETYGSTLGPGALKRIRDQGDWFISRGPTCWATQEMSVLYNAALERAEDSK
jgi:hypothetical protein